MTVRQLIYRNLKKNIRNYYLYVFALIFSVAMYFSFVTLQYDPAMDEAKESTTGSAAILPASVLLIGIIAVFLLYANTIFIKRRGREIGLFQLIGMTKGKIFKILTAENMLLYFGSLFIGIFLGFAVSRLIKMILFRITGVEIEATLSFYPEALIQTLAVFAGIYLLIMLMNFLFIKRQGILSLFQLTSTAEAKVKRMSFWEMLLGTLGIGLIIFGYYVSTKLFSLNFNLFPVAMLGILASVIFGTYLFYKGSVSFIFHLIRKKKDGYLNLNDVLSLSTLMFRMKSNAMLLTVITTVSALAIGLLSLTYITYYSAEASAEQYVPHHFSLVNQEDAEDFTSALEAQEIPYEEEQIEVVEVEADIAEILEANVEEAQFDMTKMVISAVSDAEVEEIDVSPNETRFTGYSQVLDQMIPLKDSGQIVLNSEKTSVEQTYLGLHNNSILPLYYTGGGLPVAVVDHTVFEELKMGAEAATDSVYTGINLQETSDMEEANTVFQEINAASEFAGNMSRVATSTSQKMNMGLYMFIVGFLGLAFLITSGCILYFKQMDESEDEKGSYTILRKLGFTRGDLLRGIRMKQAFNFGIPLVIGLSHSYFAVKSGWFLFGTELWTPMIIVMIVYTALYSIFGMLSVLYYKRVIREAL